MVHGGLRYLAAGDIKLTKESVQERQRLLKEAPGLVDPISFISLLEKEISSYHCYEDHFNHL